MSTLPTILVWLVESKVKASQRVVSALKLCSDLPLHGDAKSEWISEKHLNLCTPVTGRNLYKILSKKKNLEFEIGYYDIDKI